MSFVLAVLLLMQSGPTLRVTDPWGLPIAGAEVKVANATLTPGDHGEVTLPANPAGELEIEVIKLANRAIQVTRTAVLLGLGMPQTVRAGLIVKFGGR